MLIINCGGKFYTDVYNAPQLMEECNMFFPLLGNRQYKKEQLETVNIDRDGIVSLNLNNEVVQSKIKAQIDKLKKLDDSKKAAK